MIDQAMIDLTRQVKDLQTQVNNLVKPEKSSDLISPFLDLPGLVGFWPMSSVQGSTGNAYDLSGQGRTLTYNGNPTYNIYNNLVPYIDLDGTGDFLSRADEAGLDISGTETIYASGVRGLTMGGYFWAVAAGAAQGLISKWNGAGNQRSYLVDIQGDGSAAVFVSVDGSAITSASSGAASVSAAAFHFVVGRFTPSSELAIFLDGVKTTNTTSIPASIHSGTSALQVGAFNAGMSLLTGRASHCFLCANALPDATVGSLFQRTRGAFGV
jgi:hypothetical protein